MVVWVVNVLRIYFGRMPTDVDKVCKHEESGEGKREKNGKRKNRR